MIVKLRTCMGSPARTGASVIADVMAAPINSYRYGDVCATFRISARSGPHGGSAFAWGASYLNVGATSRDGKAERSFKGSARRSQQIGLCDDALHRQFVLRVQSPCIVESRNVTLESVISRFAGIRIF